MDIFRRLFSNKPEPKNTGAAAAQNEQPPASAPASAAPPTPPAENKGPRTTVEGDVRPAYASTGTLVDGVTRPLPQDALIDLKGNEHIAFGQATDVGMVRSNNQDSAYSFFSTSRSVLERPDFGLFIVADGMGGHHDGEKASAIAARSVFGTLTSKVYVPMLAGDERYNDVPITEAMTEAILKANSEIVQKVPDGGTTLTALMIIGDMAYMAHVGDSRLYLIHRDKLEQLTRDHSLVQRLLELDQITADEALDHPQKNVLYRALGQNEQIEVDTLMRRLPPRSRVLLCSDGLWNQVDERQIWEVVSQYPNPQDACSELVRRANASGGLDNVTVILLQLPG